MNSNQLRTLLSEHACTLEAFGGVFPIDKLPGKIDTYPSLMIVNTDESHQPGSHWVCIYIANPNWGYFFDSYGFEPLFWDYRLNNFMHSNTSGSFSWNTSSLQLLDSFTCGEWCMLAADSLCRQQPQSDPEVKIPPLTEHQLRRWVENHFRKMKFTMIDCTDFDQQTCSCMKVNLCNRRFIL